MGRLDVEFTHSHKTDGTQLEVGLFDPSGFRGTSRFSKKNGAVAATVPLAVSPATFTHALPVRPGDWINLRLRDAAGITAISNPVYVR